MFNKRILKSNVRTRSKLEFEPRNTDYAGQTTAKARLSTLGQAYVA